MLRQNQLKAIHISNENDFTSGVHFHATGTGKSWIALQMILDYNVKYPKHNIFWICEQKFILQEQFDLQTIKAKGFEKIFSTFHILNFVDNKCSTWHNSVNSTRFWNKPALVIINRAYLVSGEKYKKINIPIHFIIHDECHSISNSTTRTFYDYFLNKYPFVKSIGFSATPNLDYEPYKNILSHYSIYDSFLDDVIVPPKIIWFKSNETINYQLILDNIPNLLEQMPYKKIIIWCGMIDLCFEMAELWKKHPYFEHFIISTDTSVENDNQKFCSFEEFEQAPNNALLFCACKHREGSDIFNLDTCIFLDKVENRNPKTFVQCVGRVLRKDKTNTKKYGLIIDVKASSSIKICDRMNEYLHIDKNIFPWQYSFYKSKNIYINTLLLSHNLPISSHFPTHQLSIDNIKEKFIKPIPNDPIYHDRLYHELQLIHSKNLTPYLLQAIEILEITNHLVHVTRGSCGSSLVCYMLGISHVDPIKYNVKFARFLNIFRTTLPDIDFDFPHFIRDEVFLKLQLRWPGQVARISNHVHYHKKSATREALRSIGKHKFIAKNDIDLEIRKLPIEERNIVQKKTKELEDTFRCYSLHCGGIIFFPEGVPSELILESKKHQTISQVTLNKQDVANNKNFKIDILSSRALSQLYECHNYQDINFEQSLSDIKTIKLLKSGNNIGITLAESPLMKKALMKIQPENIKDLAICLAIIRPAAKSARYEYEQLDSKQEIKDALVFDDDAISLISDLLKCDDDTADKYRKGFAKNDASLIKEFKTKITDKTIIDKLNGLRKYSFCKSHALSYAQLVWQIAYMKANHPYKFWKATLTHNQSSYRKWVHYFEAKTANINFNSLHLKKNDCSIYADSRRRNFYELSYEEQMKKYGYWDMNKYEFYPGCYGYTDDEGIYHYNGIIASLRVLNFQKNKTAIVLYISVAPHSYIEVHVKQNINLQNKYIGIKGNGIFTDSILSLVESKTTIFY